MKTPNLFDFATSELSQDAFLCWLLSWADSSLSKINLELNLCASNFIQLLIDESTNYKITSIHINRQWRNIDIFACINNEYVLIIEDKKKTSEHSNQLKRYADIVSKQTKCRNMKTKFIYFKMEEQSDYRKVIDAGYKIFTRSDMLNLLSKHCSSSNKLNDILYDYYINLKELDNKISSYIKTPVKSWDSYSWQGFYSELQKHINGKWKYIPNKSGGFMGFSWNWNSLNYKHHSFKTYIQLQQDKLVFKIYCENSNIRKEIKNSYSKELFLIAKEMKISVCPYGKLGKSMGVAKLKESYLKTDNDDIIDISKTIEVLKKAEYFINSVTEKFI